MQIAELDYELPEELIAQRPVDRRDASRLLVVRRGEPSRLEHRRFHELPELLETGDLLILNDARVLPARVEALRPSGGRVEILFLAPVRGTVVSGRGTWRALARPARRVRPGERLMVGETELEVVADAGAGERHLRRVDGGSIVDLLERRGRMPLPPYIRPEDDPARARLDRTRYQTVYASVPGAVAAPTAGLHFTPELLERLRGAGVEIARITLHVGPGTFRPVTAERVEDHVMDGERAAIPEATAVALREARAAGRRVLAVGTTSVRTLEHAATRPEGIVAGERLADLFITPGHRFRAVDGMLTNFHLPRSTPLLLVAAMIGAEPLRHAYAEAVRRRYRFYSYGDAMLVLP